MLDCETRTSRLSPYAKYVKGAGLIVGKLSGYYMVVPTIYPFVKLLDIAPTDAIEHFSIIIDTYGIKKAFNEIVKILGLNVSGGSIDSLGLNLGMITENKYTTNTILTAILMILVAVGKVNPTANLYNAIKDGISFDSILSKLDLMTFVELIDTAMEKCLINFDQSHIYELNDSQHNGFTILDNKDFSTHKTLFTTYLHTEEYFNLLARCTTKDNRICGGVRYISEYSGAGFRLPIILMTKQNIVACSELNREVELQTKITSICSSINDIANFSTDTVRKQSCVFKNVSQKPSSAFPFSSSGTSAFTLSASSTSSSSETSAFSEDNTNWLKKIIEALRSKIQSYLGASY